MDQKTIDTYNELAKKYDAETLDFWDRFPKTIINKFIEFAKGKVLDVGSGPGRDGLILKKNGLEVMCLDASEAMVKLSQERGLLSILGDFNALPFPEEFFDGVWAYTSLLHVPKSEIAKIFMEIRRVLKMGGIFGLGLIEGNTELYRENLGIGKQRWFSFYKKNEVEKLLTQNGFEIIYFEEFKPKTKNYLNFISKKK
ncbi:methyltransferase domain-containing protein [Candidatus Wolfebacteria bacterium]|nr:methyltransferase domain-containing protein [Candidatus Wolfebacteria bacterium]